MSINKESRRLSRITAVNALFAYISREQAVEIGDCLEHVITEVHEVKDDKMARELIQYASEHFGKLKVLVRVHAPEFTFEKIAPINRAILLIGLAELKYMETPPVVVINEYIEIAKQYGEAKSASFVNGVLDAFRKSIGKERGKSE